jgi:hypothetical protein
MHTYIHTHKHRYMHTCRHTYTYTYIHAYMHAYIHTHKHRYMHRYIHTYIHTYIHNIHTYIHAYMHTYNNTYIHTQGNLPSALPSPPKPPTPSSTNTSQEQAHCKSMLKDLQENQDVHVKCINQEGKQEWWKAVVLKIVQETQRKGHVPGVLVGYLYGKRSTRSHSDGKGANRNEDVESEEFISMDCLDKRIKIPASTSSKARHTGIILAASKLYACLQTDTYLFRRC